MAASSTSSSSAPHPAEPPPVPAALARAHTRYWRFNVALIVILMAIGFVVSFVVPCFAPALAPLRFAGFSLPFYLGAQGAILVYLMLIFAYIVLMQRADRVLRRAYDEAGDRTAQHDGGR
jgi:putative solute:sodium symporter small subunit